MYKNKSRNRLLFTLFIIIGLFFLVFGGIVRWKNSRNSPVDGQETKTPSILDLPIFKEKVVEPAVEFKQPGVSAVLPSAKWVSQSYNNCGPATTAMALQYFGYNVSQVETKDALRTNPSDSNVFTYEIRDYLKNNYNIEGKLLFNGNVQILKTLLTNGIYLVMENWLRPNEDIGHNMTIRGYDDELGVFIADDPYFGVGVKYKYESFEQGQWKPFNREYMPIYRIEQEPLVKAIIGRDWDEKTMYQGAVKTSKVEIEKNKDDMYAWFNLGTSYYALGDYKAAREAFERSRAIGWPMRMLWYQIQPVQTYNKLGEYQKALELAKIGLATYEPFAELYLESAIAYKGMSDLVKAREKIDRALVLAPNYMPALLFKESLSD